MSEGVKGTMSVQDLSAIALSSSSGNPSAIATPQETISKQETDTPEPVEIDSEEVAASVELLNQMSNFLNREIDFEFIEPEGIIQAHLKNSDSKEIIRSIPSDAAILVRKKIDAFLGLFIDELR